MLKTSEHRLKIKTRLKRRQKVLGGWNSLYHPTITEVFIKAGLGFIGLDLEHSTISLEQTQNLIATCQGLGCVCLPRVASHNPEMIKRVLDSGADGVIVPMVNSPAEAEKIVGWVKYPPLGHRSFGVARAQGYGLDYDAYVKDWNKSSILIVQIESEQGVKNIEKILSFKEIDGVMIGPYDLSGSLGIPGQLDHPAVREACEKVNAACRKHRVACGTHLVEAEPEKVEAAFSNGFSFVILSSDVFLLWKWAERTRGVVKKYGR
jgi:2-dehydro-3-deoxyglucarate aldolase